MKPGDRVETVVLGHWVPGTIEAHGELDTWLVRLDRRRQIGNGGPWVSLVFRGRGDLRPPAPPPPSDAVRLAAARFVADHWREAGVGRERHALGWGTAVAHAMCCVLAAIDGECDPEALGLTEDAHEAFRSMLAEFPKGES